MPRIYEPGDIVYVIDVEVKVLERIGTYYLVEFQGESGKKLESLYSEKHIHHMRFIDRIIRIEEKLELE